jgi:CarD family transcriptional regulator
MMGERLPDHQHHPQQHDDGPPRERRTRLTEARDGEQVKKVIGVLTDDVPRMPKNWNRRFKHNREKIKTGDVYELAEVVRNLAIREWEKGLSTGEKQMYTRAKKILASEFMYVLEKDEDGAEAYLDELLEERFGAAKATA